MSGERLADVWDDWQDAVNMSQRQLQEWLETDESRSVGQKDGGGEATGHKSGRRIVEILGTNKETSATTTLTTCAQWSATCTATWPRGPLGTSSGPRGGTR